MGTSWNAATGCINPVLHLLATERFRAPGLPILQGSLRAAPPESTFALAACDLNATTQAVHAVAAARARRECCHGPADMRGFVRFQLPEISKYTGMLAPLTAKNVLERFWDSGYTTWDQCFDKPYAFIMQPSVERSKVPS